MNKAMIIGRLGDDPVKRYTQSGMPVCSLSVATNESYTDREGNRVDRTEWHRITVFNKQAEHCSMYLRKGSLVYVEGRLTTRKWQDKDGQDRYTTEIRADRIEFLDRRSDGQQQSAQAGMSSYGSDGEGYRSVVPQRQSAPQDNYTSNDVPDSPFPSEATYIDNVPF